ncbi:MAG: bifunctional phosphopantothenoylcysteine decarboxylase/phosphopantothenate--cysteine ligase CoaBC [Saprospiraceae bacterium]|nr:bifunctional phosphopantothenoylcysteine decarboxylase/phosphopantothenate--cysteine ligase CoaBC [Saprospiraceae bacterium]
MAGQHPPRVLLGITGSIAAYKSAELTRLLIKSGFEVKCLMTDAATQFISPLTLSTLSKNPVVQGLATEGLWNNHVELGLWADVMVIAPLTANTLGKMVNGLADNLLVATYLSAKCPVMLAPAMDLDMWHHFSTQDNLQRALIAGNHLIPVGNGELASGLIGEGRMAEPEEILQHISRLLAYKSDLSSKKVLITAGPTYEHIDPVRFIGNHSSGKMGIALANEALARGAEVTLVLGPTKIKAKQGVKTISVTTAQQMFDACADHFDQSDIVIWAAAVADYAPKTVATQKIKKEGENMQLDLVKTVDIAAHFGQKKKPNQVLVGFALETQDEVENARKKVIKKNLDFIVLNSLNEEGAGFGHDTNKVSFLYPDGQKANHSIKTKDLVAKDIIDAINTL